MAQEFEISVGSIYTILRYHLKMRKVLARWVPHLDVGLSGTSFGSGHSSPFTV